MLYKRIGFHDFILFSGWKKKEMERKEKEMQDDIIASGDINYERNDFFFLRKISRTHTHLQFLTNYFMCIFVMTMTMTKKKLIMLIFDFQISLILNNNEKKNNSLLKQIGMWWNKNGLTNDEENKFFLYWITIGKKHDDFNSSWFKKMDEISFCFNLNFWWQFYMNWNESRIKTYKGHYHLGHWNSMTTNQICMEKFC